MADKKQIRIFIDFQTLTSLFTPPMIGSDEIIGFDTQNYIFMIGLGWEDPDTGKWQYQDFTVNKVTLEEESKIISDMWKLVDSLMTKYQITTLPNFIIGVMLNPHVILRLLKDTILNLRQ